MNDIITETQAVFYCCLVYLVSKAIDKALTAYSIFLNFFTEVLGYIIQNQLSNRDWKPCSSGINQRNWNNWINIPAHFPKYKIEQTIDLLSADWRAKFEMEWRIFFLKGNAIVMVMPRIPALGLLLVVMIEGWLFFISLRWHRHVWKVYCRFCKRSYRSMIILITV